MHRIDLAMLEPEAGLARGKQQRGVKTWAPAIETFSKRPSVSGCRCGLRSRR